jgi:polygalacturonase
MLSRLSTSLVFAVTIFACSAQAAATPRVFNVLDYGAVGDGKTMATVAIQKAVDACSQAGGGTVYIGPGNYLSGTVFLKNDVRLYLDVNATLRGSPRLEDYPPINRKNALGRPAFQGGFLLYADGARNVSIEGRGTIDGQGPAFWLNEKCNAFVKKPIDRRPRAMICLVKCKSLLFRDISLVNSPCYTLWLLGCDDINIEGLTIRNPHDGPNTDGIDIDCCSRARISHCDIDGGDDAIALKSDAGTLLEDKPCEDIVVTNCVLRSKPACAVRIGYEGDSVIRNCAFSNLTIQDADIGLDIISILPGPSPSCSVTKGTRCENITFTNIAMRDVNRAIFFWMGNQTANRAQVHLKDILVSNVVAQSRIGSYIGGFTAKDAENITLSNVRLTLTGEMPSQAAASGTDIWGGTPNPYGLYCAQIDGLRIANLDIDARQAKGPWRHAVYCENVANATLDDVAARGLAARSAASQIGLKNSKGIIRNSVAETGIAAFLQANDKSKAYLTGCDLSEAKRATLSDSTGRIQESGNRLP